MWLPKISVQLKTVTETKTNEVNVTPNFSIFKHFLVLILKPLIANHKTENRMLKLKVTGAQSQLLSCNARILGLYIESHLKVGLHTLNNNKLFVIFV